MSDFKTIKYDARNPDIREMIKYQCKKLGISKQELIDRALLAKLRTWQEPKDK